VGGVWAPQGQTLAADDPWGVRILPRVAFGAHPSGVDGVDPHSPGVYALHHFMGSWKKTGGWQQSTGIHQLLAKLTKPWAVKAEEASPAAPAGGAEEYGDAKVANRETRAWHGATETGP
jgi:hypothetical protein